MSDRRVSPRAVEPAVIAWDQPCPTVTYVGRRRRRRVSLAWLATSSLVAGCYVSALHARLLPSRATAGPAPAGALAWPGRGQAAVVATGWSHAKASPDQQPAPIASVAKLMTAYVVLKDLPTSKTGDGHTLRIGQADVDDTEARAAQDQSVVKVELGEELTERQALEALLIPSANNVAVMLARWAAGSVAAFVSKMNATARSWGLADTQYTDPSGFDPATVSTAADQLVVARHAMGMPVLAQIVGMPRAVLPVAGAVRSTDSLLGHDGFVGVKTGSDDAAGGCFAFQANRVVAGRRVLVVGVVLGQRDGSGLLSAAFDAARSLAAQAAT